MRIKHWQGYGCVNAKVVKRSYNTLTKENSLVIRVWGNHEYGLDRSEYSYDVNNWLVKKVAKINIDDRKIVDIQFKYIPDIEGQEAAEYSIVYKD